MMGQNQIGNINVVVRRPSHPVAHATPSSSGMVKKWGSAS